MTFDEFQKEWENASDAIEVRTSGSTGIPKVIKLSKDFVKESALRTLNFFGLGEGCNFHSCVAADYIGGKMMAVRAILANGNFSWEQPSNRPLQGSDKTVKIDLLAVVSSQMPFILDNLETLPEIKNIIVGGGVIPQQIRDRIAGSGLNVYETYGMTETASHIAMRRVSVEELPFSTLGDITVSLDSRGCLAIQFPSGESVMTNDLAKVLSPKEFEILGRYDNMIITGGVKVNPQEVEKILSPFIDSPYIITAFKDDKWGEKIVLVIEGKEEACLKEKVIETCRERLTPCQMPKEIIFYPSLPRTANGKLIRTKSREDYSSVAP